MCSSCLRNGIWNLISLWIVPACAVAPPLGGSCIIAVLLPSPSFSLIHSFIHSFILFYNNMVKLGNVDLFLVIAIVVAVSILLVVAFYLLVNYQHPDDKNEAYLPKAVVVFGFCLAGITVLMLPLDVANNEGYAGCRRIRYQTLWRTQYDSHVDHCLLDDSSLGLCILIPWTTFYYEADDGMLMAGTAVTPNPVRKSKIAQACCNQIFVLIIVGLLFSLTYLFLSNTNIPVEAYNGAKASQVDCGRCCLHDIATRWEFQYLPTGRYRYSGMNCSTHKFKIWDKKPWFFKSTWPHFMVDSWHGLGWFLLAIFGGIGMAALPLDLDSQIYPTSQTHGCRRVCRMSHVIPTHVSTNWWILENN